MRVRLIDVACALAFTAAVTALAVTVWYQPPPAEPAEPVAYITARDMAVIADLLRSLDQRPSLAPAERATVDRVAEAVEAVNAGTVVIVPAADPIPPTTTTTTSPTTTTTEANGPGNPVGHPNVDAPPVTLPPTADD